MKQDVFEIEEAMRNYYQNELLNRVLYDMCEKYPDHKSLKAVRAKSVIIGRTYASGAERHVIPVNGDLAEPLVNTLFNSRRWLDREIKNINTKHPDHVPSVEIIKEIALLHGRLLTEFKPVTRGEHGIRSFASKYLHFHAPVFPIYDSIAKKVITRRAKGDFEGFYPWVPAWNHEFPCPTGADPEYWRFCVRVAMMRRDWVNKKFSPTARHLDICLLYWQ